MNEKTDRPENDDADQAEIVVPTDTGEAADADQKTDSDLAEGDPLAELQVKADENWNRYLRTAAEMENVRKRAARDVENAHKFALERIIGDLLDVRDSLEMSLSAGDEVSVVSLKEGHETTLKLLVTVMQRFGVEEINPEGEPFDPNRHEAMTMQPSADAEPGSILTIFQKGYALNGRLLRPARVVVASEPAENAK